MSRTRLYGTYEHSIDDKSRVTLPAEFRTQFADGAVLVRLPAQPNCVSVYNEEDWKEVEDRFIESQDDFDDPDIDWSNRSIYMYMSRAVPDRQGRVLITANVSHGLDLAGKVTIVGNRNRLEIWNPATLARELEKHRRRLAGRNSAKERGDES